ncbi:TPA: type I restriction endonuclease subunit R, partial [Escherichia coli]
NLLRQKYRGDVKYARTHKRLRERGGLSEPERKIFEALLGVKLDADEKVLNNSQILNNESYFERQIVSCVLDHFEQQQHITLSAKAAGDINRLIVAEYLNEFNTGARTW